MSEKHVSISPRKIAANRLNAQKSTGPKTARGKSYSRRNAFQHGLFSMSIFVGEGAKRENSHQYQELLDRLCQDYQPVGAAEMLEVERIAACWWKLGRAWRYENSEISFEHHVVDERAEELKSLTARVPDGSIADQQATINLFKRAAAEIETAGKISDQLRKEMARANGRFQELWLATERLVQKALSDATIQGTAENEEVQPDPDLERRLLLKVLQTAIQVSMRQVEANVEMILKDAYDNRAVLKPEVLDRLQRAEASAERSLNRAIDRLERMQRRRLGEVVPPPLSLRLSR